MKMVTLKTVKCPKCKGPIENVNVDQEYIETSPKIPVLVTAKCSNGHSCVLFVDRNLTIRDIEEASAVIQEDTTSAVDKAQKWMSDF